MISDEGLLVQNIIRIFSLICNRTSYQKDNYFVGQMGGTPDNKRGTKFSLSTPTHAHAMEIYLK